MALFARPAGSFLDMEHDITQPLNQAIQTNVRMLFPGTPLLSWQPRASIAYKLSEKMALHAGGGVFNDIIPAQVADLGAAILRMRRFSLVESMDRWAASALLRESRIVQWMLR